jgi:hypothetical protein
MIRKSFRNISIEYSDLENLLGKDHLQITRIKDGAFSRYMDEQIRAGADLAHIKPTHMQAPDKVINRLLQ